MNFIESPDNVLDLKSREILNNNFETFPTFKSLNNYKLGWHNFCSRKLKRSFYEVKFATKSFEVLYFTFSSVGKITNFNYVERKFFL